MADIALRFHKDMLVLSAPIDAVLRRQGLDPGEPLELTGIIEPEAVRAALRLNTVAGAQCVVTNTAAIAPARLAANAMDGREHEVVDAAFAALRGLAPQHVLAQIGPCGLPLDASSVGSLNENRDDYRRAAQAFDGRAFDAFFLNGFRGPDDLKCALTGVWQVSDLPIVASVDVDGEGLLADGRHTLEDALAVMLEFGASVVGFSTAAPLPRAVAFARRACGLGGLPVLVQLEVGAVDQRQGEATEDNPYYCPDTMVQAAAELRACGVQFLRAAGAATPAYTGALVAASEGLDVVRAAGA